jgi:MazG family protein
MPVAHGGLAIPYGKIMIGAVSETPGYTSRFSLRPRRFDCAPMPSAIDDLIATVARLRAPGGCPWDIEQTHKSICDCLIEEVSELIDTIDRHDIPHMREELGDLLLHVVMHAQMATERDDFSFDEVAREINEKMIRRHPHVFGENALADSDAVVRQWDEIKAGEKKNGPKNEGPFKDLHPSLSSILTAREVWKAVSKKQLPHAATVDDARVNSLAEGLTEESAGKALFELVAACRKAGVDPESALRRHTLLVKKTAEGR